MYNNNVTKQDLVFGLSLMQKLSEKDSNVSISPTSIRSALSMLYEGANGNTAKEIADVAKLPTSDNERKTTYSNISKALNAKDEEYQLEYANGLWVAKDLPLEEKFAKILSSVYGAKTENVDFRKNADGEREKINKWVEDKTKDKIKELFGPDTLNQYTSLVLCNALYFKADWEKPFDKKYTKSEDFLKSDGEKIKVDMMKKGEFANGKHPKQMYAEKDGMQVVMLPYVGRQLSAFFLLPPKGTSLDDTLEYLQDKSNPMYSLSREMREEEFSRLEIPKHEINCSYILNNALQSMGMKEAFDIEHADFSGISKEQTGVSLVNHKTFFKTNEEGSEGAAATGIGMMRCMAMVEPPKKYVEFVANRPFLESVIDNRTGTVLFLNRIENPNI